MPLQGHATAEQITAYKNAGSHPIHAASKPGILCVAVDKKDPNVVATGGADSVAMLFNKSSGKVVGTLAGHKKKVSQPTPTCSPPQSWSCTRVTTSMVYIERGRQLLIRQI